MRQLALRPDHDLQARAIRVDHVPVGRVVEILVEQRLTECRDDAREVPDDRVEGGIRRHEADVDVRERVSGAPRVRSDEQHGDHAFVRPADLDHSIEPRLDVLRHRGVARSRGSTSVAIRSKVASWLGSGG